MKLKLNQRTQTLFISMANKSFSEAKGKRKMPSKLNNNEVKHGKWKKLVTHTKYSIIDVRHNKWKSYPDEIKHNRRQA